MGSDENNQNGYSRAQISLARFYMTHIASHTEALAKTVAQGGPAVAGFPDQGF